MNYGRAEAASGLVWSSGLEPQGSGGSNRTFELLEPGLGYTRDLISVTKAKT